MNWFERHWKRTPTPVRKPFIFLLGFAIVIAGIILLPLPGPGWVIIFAGFAVLATEFAFALRVRDRLIGFLKIVIAYAKRAWVALRREFDKWMQS